MSPIERASFCFRTSTCRIFRSLFCLSVCIAAILALARTIPRQEDRAWYIRMTRLNLRAASACTWRCSSLLLHCRTRSASRQNARQVASVAVCARRAAQIAAASIFSLANSWTKKPSSDALDAASRSHWRRHSRRMRSDNCTKALSLNAAMHTRVMRFVRA